MYIPSFCGPYMQMAPPALGDILTLAATVAVGAHRLHSVVAAQATDGASTAFTADGQIVTWRHPASYAFSGPQCSAVAAHQVTVLRNCSLLAGESRVPVGASESDQLAPLQRCSWSWTGAQLERVLETQTPSWLPTQQTKRCIGGRWVLQVSHALSAQNAVPKT